MDTKITIQKNIEIPRPNSRNGISKYPWTEMDIGDSFLFPPSLKAAAVYANVQSARERTKLKFSIRKTPEGFRCWRIA